MFEGNSNRRVAKNTLVLYIPMIFTMIIGMWTSRIVLNALGFTDLGLYNLVGGFVGMLSLVSGSVNGAFSRFLTYQIGRGDSNELNRVFRNATTVQWALSLVIIFLAETVGLWFVHNKMVIPPDRMHAVMIVYQLSVLSFVLELISTAPSALVIAYERMSIFAGVTIVNSLGRLVIALIIAHSAIDRLILYATLLVFMSGCTRVFYTLYCKRAFPFLKIGFSFDKDLFGSIFSFAGWNSIGTSAAILRGSGTSVLLNLFGGPIANAINGIANSLNNLTLIFVNDFTTAYSPQITKRYAAGDYSSLIRFIHQCSKFSYCLLLIMAIPVMVNAGPLMTLWLKKIPDGTVLFGRLIIVFSLIECLSKPLITAKNATGDIKSYQIVVGGILLLTLPISYIFLKIGLPIWFAYIAIILTSIGAFAARLLMLKGAIPGWSSRIFLTTTLSRCIFATGVSVLVPLLLHATMPDTPLSVLIQCAIGFFWCCLCVYFIACNSEERKILYGILSSILKRVGFQA